MLHESDSTLKAVQGMTMWSCAGLVARMKRLEDHVWVCGDFVGESRFGGIANVRQILGKAGTEGTLTIAFMCEV